MDQLGASIINQWHYLAIAIQWYEMIRTSASTSTIVKGTGTWVGLGMSHMPPPQNYQHQTREGIVETIVQFIINPTW